MIIDPKAVEAVAKGIDESLPWRGHLPQIKYEQRQEAQIAITAYHAYLAEQGLVIQQGPQNIESAPKDGTKFWGLVDEDAIAMFWHDGFQEFISGCRRMEMAPGYTFEDGSTFKDHSPRFYCPKFWIPALTPPAEQGDEK